jgi:hypothetical protein
MAISETAIGFIAVGISVLFFGSFGMIKDGF